MNPATLPTIEDLSNCRLPELQKVYAQVIGEPTRSPNKKFLMRRITEALEEQAAREAEASQPEPLGSESLPPEGPNSEATRNAGGDSGKLLSKLTIEELQQRYVEVVGRPTGSDHRRYLIWKIRQAEKGKIPTGPRNRRNPGDPAPEFKILPIRMEADLVERIDQARERLGHESRMALFRNALNAYFNLRGETELAAFFAPRG